MIQGKFNASDESITEDMVNEQLTGFNRNMDATSSSTSQVTKKIHKYRYY